MKRKSILLLLAMVLLLFAARAQAASSCSAPVLVFSSGFSATYISTNPTNITSTTMTGGCKKPGNNFDGYTVSADNGLNFNLTNRAILAGNFINYFVSTSPTCGNTWNTTNLISLTFTSNNSQTPTYYGCIVPGQIVPAGTYIDTVTMKANIGGTGTFNVSITVAPLCTLPPTLGPVAFTYTAFGGVATANTTFGVTCTPSLPYTMALDATSGVVTGLNYSLVLRNSTDTANVTGGTGNGVAQSYRINGTMAAGQAGTCTTGTCVGTDPGRTLTISY